MSAPDLTTRAVNFIHFHGMTLLVVLHDGVEYVLAKPFADLACIDWKSARRTLLTDENIRLFGVRELLPPEINGERGKGTPRTEVYFELQYARLYLARINTAIMRGKGSVQAADDLHTLQREWGRALHHYETLGAAVKDNTAREVDALLKLQTARDRSKDAKERRALTLELHKRMRAMGMALLDDDDAQAQLPLGGAA